MSKIINQEIIDYFNNNNPFGQWLVVPSLPSKINSVLDLDFKYAEAIYTHLNFKKIGLALDIYVGQDIYKNIIYSSPIKFHDPNDGYSTIDSFDTVSIQLFSNHNYYINFINSNYLNNKLFANSTSGLVVIKLSQLYDIMRYLAKVSNMAAFT